MSMTDRAVREQYDALPYPARDPRDEAKRLVVGSPSHLAEVEHWLGTGDAAQPWRVLVAGGGTGDASVMLAQQAARAGRAVEIVHLEPSAAARSIAAARLEARGLTSVRLVEGTIEALPSLGLGVFDYIDCCGVLHHLADPATGLAALTTVLAPTGGMGVMVYGRFGRTGVYELQAALAQLVPPGPPAQRVAAARRVMAGLPASHPFRLNRQVGDHLVSDAGFYDLLLHPRDRAYDVAELLALVAGAGLAPVTMMEPVRYDPTSWLNHPEPKRQAAALPLVEQWALAERLSGAMPRHVVYVARPGATAPVAVSEAAVPRWRDLCPPGLAADLARGSLTLDDGVVRLQLVAPRGASAVVSRLDGQRSIAAIAADLPMRDAVAVTLETVRLLIACNLVLLRRGAES